MLPAESTRDVDILFVIDNSGSMAEEQASLSSSFNSRFLSVFGNLAGGLPNLHIGVVSTDVGAGPFDISGCSGEGDHGMLQSAPSGPCTPPIDAFISDVDDGAGGRLRNYTGTLGEAFSCISRLGIEGCGFEQTLESMRRALNGSNPSNDGFLRPGAALAVIFLSDEDDCSVSDSGLFDPSQSSISDPLGPLSSFRCFEFGVVCDEDEAPRATGPRTGCTSREDSAYMRSVREYAEFLKALKDDPHQVIVAGIIGDPSPVAVTLGDDSNPLLARSCVSSAGEALPAVRLNHFLAQFPGRSGVVSVCADDFSDALIEAAWTVASGLGWPCLVADIDVDLDAPGVQHSCEVTELLFDGEQVSAATALPECSTAAPDDAELPCWRIAEDRELCAGTASGLMLEVFRNQSPPARTYVELECLSFEQ